MGLSVMGLALAPPQPGDPRALPPGLEFVFSSRRLANGTFVVAASAEVDLYTAPELEQALAGPLAEGTTRLVVDLSEATFVDSTAGVRDRRRWSLLLGVLHVGTLAPRDFSPDEIELLQIVAERAALAIEKAPLHRELVEVDELLTPATSVFGVLATLHGRGDEPPDEQRRQLLEVGYEQGARLTRLLEQLLDLPGWDVTTIALKPRPLVLRSVLAETLSNSTLVLDRIISNLRVNAQRHGSPPVVVAAEQRDGRLRISVEDAGPGIPDELRRRIFERFGRGEDVQGSGLGHTIARAYAPAHGGDLVYQPLVRGARFELILPRS